MQTEKVTFKNFTTRINDVFPTFDVIKVIPLSNYSLFVEFEDGLYGVVEMKNKINSNNAGIFEPLKELNIFNSVEINNGAVSWLDKNTIEIIGNNKFFRIIADLAPDVMYKEIQANKLWILR